MTKTPPPIMIQTTPMTVEQHRHGPLDTDIVIPRAWIDPAELPGEMAIAATTLAEQSAGPHELRGNPWAPRCGAILEETVREQDNFAEALMETFAGLGGVDLEVPSRTAQARAMEFGDATRGS